MQTVGPVGHIATVGCLDWPEYEHLFCAVEELWGLKEVKSLIVQPFAWFHLYKKVIYLYLYLFVTL